VPLNSTFCHRGKRVRGKNNTRLVISEEEGPFRRTRPLLPYEKAETAACAEGEGIFIGADTVVLIDGSLLGKPRDRKEARKMLKRLSGRTHTVITAFCVLDAATGRKITRAVESRVKIKGLTIRRRKSTITSKPESPWTRQGPMPSRA
jgi:predicted house-cleaning NTP pyrophosphatase (Maf/HAM1 superfamily)